MRNFHLQSPFVQGEGRFFIVLRITENDVHLSSWDKLWKFREYG